MNDLLCTNDCFSFENCGVLRTEDVIHCADRSQFFSNRHQGVVQIPPLYYDVIPLTQYRCVFHTERDKSGLSHGKEIQEQCRLQGLVDHQLTIYQVTIKWKWAGSGREGPILQSAEPPRDRLTVSPISTYSNSPWGQREGWETQSKGAHSSTAAACSWFRIFERGPKIP